MAFFREPLVHFFGLAALIFGFFLAFDDAPDIRAAERVVVSADVVAGLQQRFTQTWQRPPTEPEMDNLIAAYVDEEILVREALLLGLDRNDAVVRQRLALKMKFLLESGAAQTDAEDAELQVFLDANADRFQRAARISFEQILLEQPASASQVLAALETGQSPSSLGAATLLTPRIDNAPARTVDSVFGAGFFDQISALETRKWVGPVQSGYGAHLVRVGDFNAAVVPSLDAIRDDVLRQWVVAKTQEVAQERLEALRLRYEILREDASEGAE